jgi:hypothetical protein
MAKKQEITNPENLIPGSVVTVLIKGIDWDVDLDDEQLDENEGLSELPANLLVTVEVEEDMDLQAVDNATGEIGWCINNVKSSQIVGNQEFEILVKVDAALDHGCAELDSLRNAVQVAVKNALDHFHREGFNHALEDRIAIEVKSVEVV